MAEFVRATIFGTTFEITSRYAFAQIFLKRRSMDRFENGNWSFFRYTELQPVGMGAFGLVW